MRKILISLFIGLLLGIVLGVFAHRQWLEWFPNGFTLPKNVPAAPPVQPAPVTTPPASAPVTPPPASTPPPPSLPVPAPVTNGDFPGDLPVYPGATLTARGFVNGAVVYSFSVEAKAEEVMTAYDRQFQAGGWVLEKTSAGLPLRWKKGDKTCSVSVTEVMAANQAQRSSTLIQLVCITTNQAK